jgi:polyisoprenoid-binding protein YceI
MSTTPASYTISPTSDSTLAIELHKTGLLKKRKHILFFERFSGELVYSAENPELSSVQISLDVNSVTCRDAWLKARKRQKVVAYARDVALNAKLHPVITFISERIARKPLRGFSVEGQLTICAVTRPVKLSVVVSPAKQDGLQIDGDVLFRLSDFGIARPSAFGGLIGTEDEVLIHALLWATRAP